MWEEPRRKKRWYRRWWFAIPFWTLLILGVVGGVLFLKLKGEYEAKAKEFDYSRLESMESASMILDRNGALVGRLFTQNREQVSFDELSPELTKAVMGAEDTRFREHTGVDYKGIARAVWENYRAGKDRQGASTLTQQLARNTFPEQLPPSDRTKERKILEMFVAREIEKRCTKDKIMELYLNRVYFGSGFYGAEAAAKGYFGKSAKDLSLSESAMLAAVLRSPDKLAPWRNYATCISERNRVLNRLLESKIVTREEYDAAYGDEPQLKNKRTVKQDNFAADMIYQQVLKLVGKESALGDGLKIHTTVDWALQKKTEELLRGQLLAIERHEGYEHPTYADFEGRFRAAKENLVDENGKRIVPEYLQGAVVVLNNTDGGILAVVGGRDFNHSQLNRATQVELPPGTAFTPLVFAAGFDKDKSPLFPGTAVNDAVMDNTRVMIGGTTGFLGEWGPETADNRYEGVISARTAIMKSKNAATVRFGLMTGIKDVLALADDAGISDDLAAYPKTFLGGSEVSPMDLTLSYSMFARNGVRPSDPFIVRKIEDKNGKVIFEEKPETEQVIKSTTAYEVHTCLADVLDRGTGERANSELGLKKYPLGGKTGTAYNFTDLWFVGYSSEVTTGVWIGFDQQRGKPKSAIYRGAFSKDLALPLWAEVMKSTFASYVPQAIQQPPGLIRCEICAHSGELATPKCVSSDGIPTTYHEFCTELQAPKNQCSVHTGFVAQAPGAPVDPSAPPKPKVFMDIESFKPIAMKEATIIGVDPYNSAGAIDRIKAIQGANGALAPIQTQNEIPVLDPTIPVAAAPIPVAKPLGPSPRTETKLDQPERLKFQ
jgi:membrane carboxypeptidase/penicillin-binding protein